MRTKMSEPTDELLGWKDTIPPEAADLVGELISFLIECDKEAQGIGNSQTESSTGLTKQVLYFFVYVQKLNSREHVPRYLL